VETTLNTTFIFNAAGSVQNLNGNYIENSVANFELLSTEATAVKVVEWNDAGKYYATSFADWATVTKTKYTDYSENDVLAKFSVEIAATENTTYSERFADVFVIPASKASVSFDNWFDPNTGNLKEEYSKYILGRISQIGKEKDYVALSENPEEVYLTDFVKYTEPQWWSEQLGTTNVFELVYKDKFSDAVLMFAKPFASYKIFDYDFVEVPESEYDAFWLSFLPFEQNMKGRVAMDASKFTKENVEEVQSRMSSISGVDNVTVNLKSATLRINLDMGDSMDTDAITDAVDEAYDIIDSMLPIGTYFTNHDDGKMYDLEINGYNFIPAEGQDTGGQVIVEITKTGAGKKTTDVLTKPRDKDLVDEITR
jgi:hypothetical protein